MRKQIEFTELFDAAVSQNASSQQIEDDMRTLLRLKAIACEHRAFQNVLSSFENLENRLDRALEALERINKGNDHNDNHKK